MNTNRNFRLRGFCFFLVFLAVTGAFAAELLPPGFRPLPLGVHALVGGRVVTKPGNVIEGGTIVIRDGVIQAVGKDRTPPADARVWDMKGLTIYAGFIESYLVLDATNPPVSTSDTQPIRDAALTSGGVNFFGVPGQRTDPGTTGPGYEVSKITPEERAVRGYSPRSATLAPLRELGFTTALIAPSRGILRGTSALVALSEENPNQIVLKPDVFQHVAFETHDTDERTYPGSLMGAIAVVRQSFFDAQHYARDHADYRKNPQGRKRPEFSPALEALRPAIEKEMRVVFESGSALMVNRAARLARELGLEMCLIASGQEWRRPDLARETGALFIVPVDFPTLPKLPNEDDWQQIRLDLLRAWDWAPENPALLRQQGLDIALTTYGLSDKKRFRPNLRLAIDRGLSEADALAALTTVPAKLCGVEQQLGTIEPGKLANLTVVDGKGYFEPDAKVREVWIDGRIYRAPPTEPRPGRAEVTPPDKPKLPEEGTPKRLEEPEKQPAPTEPADKAKPAAEKPPAEPAEKKDGKREQLRSLQRNRVARAPLEIRGPLAAPSAVLIRNATIWTSASPGVLTNAQLLIVDGKIKAVGTFKADLPADAVQIDAQGWHVTPGLIDCHSHTAILGAVNESTLPSTAMVRISDVVNSETENLYLQLAGGLTVANLLHGSANPIGGQNCVIKLRDGASPEGLKFEGAPAGIKFALGENVKQANWGDRNTTRFPQTRMGVRTFIANRFIAGQKYLSDWENYRKSGGAPPRRDLELETIGEILQGQRWIHCHSYRQDEILMFLRLMESFNVTIGTLQHVLEGYKVADEIAAHGAGASCFSDWWAFKFEVYDAIPYAGSLMHERGVLVSFNSDSSELARRMYLEASKAVKYGGTPEIDALNFITINPAKQLRIDNRVGSLEPGKDGDFAIWSKSPLDEDTVCLQTWIDGKKYFDVTLAGARAAQLQKERDDLIAKAKRISRLGTGGDSASDEGGDKFFRLSREHEFDGLDRHCLDEEESH